MERRPLSKNSSSDMLARSSTASRVYAHRVITCAAGDARRNAACVRSNIGVIDSPGPISLEKADGRDLAGRSGDYGLFASLTLRACDSAPTYTPISTMAAPTARRGLNGSPSSHAASRIVTGGLSTVW